MRRPTDSKTDPRDSTSGPSARPSLASRSGVRGPGRSPSRPSPCRDAPGDVSATPPSRPGDAPVKIGPVAVSLVIPGRFDHPHRRFGFVRGRWCAPRGRGRALLLASFRRPFKAERARLRLRLRADSYRCAVHLRLVPPTVAPMAIPLHAGRSCSSQRYSRSSPSRSNCSSTSSLSPRRPSAALPRSRRCSARRLETPSVEVSMPSERSITSGSARRSLARPWDQIRAKLDDAATPRRRPGPSARPPACGRPRPMPVVAQQAPPARATSRSASRGRRSWRPASRRRGRVALILRRIPPRPPCPCAGLPLGRRDGALEGLVRVLDAAIQPVRLGRRPLNQPGLDLARGRRSSTHSWPRASMAADPPAG